MKTSTGSFEKERFETYSGLKWSGVLKGIAKSQDPLQPIFEAITNSLESIRLRQVTNTEFSPYIRISLHFNPGINGEGVDLYAIEIEDNGIGFDSTNYKRLVTFKDDTKGFNNRGSGRIQFVHYFDYAHYLSYYQEGEKNYKRSFILSQSRQFIANNSLVYCDEMEAVESGQVSTKLTLESPLTDRDKKYYSNLSLEEIKSAILQHYMLSLCSLRASLPEISFYYIISEKVVEEDSIMPEDIPVPSDMVPVQVPKCRISDDMKRIEPIEDDMVSISITPFRINSENLERSEIKLTSKGEISDTAKVKITCFDPDAEIDGHRYLFLLSSQYFDDLEGDERGNIQILDKTEFKKVAKANGSICEQIVINDIQDVVNDKAAEIFVEIAQKKEEFKSTLEKLKRDYLLSDQALEEVTICDDVEEVIRKAYNYDAKIAAQQVAVYENTVNSLENLDPSSDAYDSSLNSLVDNLVESIPLQNKITLSKYVARRNMVISLMSKILERRTTRQMDHKRNDDEKLLHNLIFRQHSVNPLDSDLWLINEEYMYFMGSSEIQLSKIEVDGKKLFREEFTMEEEQYLTSLGENRLKMRCDVLLFPSEGKCVIIEFKNPDVNVSEHLNQISKYAYFIRNFSNPEFKIKTFYGYLIGEGIEKRDVRSADGDFQSAPNDEYLFRPFKRVVDDTTGKEEDGSLYMEVMKYSSLKRRAEIRNKAFIDKLTKIEG